MNIQKLNEELRATLAADINEAVGDVIRKNKTLNQNDLVEYEEGEFTYEILGVPFVYRMSKTEIEPSEAGEDYEHDKTLAGLRFELKDAAETIDLLNQKIKEHFKNQLKNLYNINVTYVGSTNLVGIPSSGKYEL